MTQAAITPLPAHGGIEGDAKPESGTEAPVGVPGAPTIRTPLLVVTSGPIVLYERVPVDSEMPGRRLVVFGGCEGVTSRESRAMALLLRDAADPNSGYAATKARLAVAVDLLDEIAKIEHPTFGKIGVVAARWRAIRAKGGE